MIDLEKTKELSDFDLVKLTLENQDYFLCIIERYKLKLGNYIKRITNVHEEDVEDLLQEVFLKVYLNLNDFDSELKFSSWIYAITRNQVISSHRKLMARVEGYSLPIDENMVKNIYSDLDIVKNIDASILKEKISSALELLPEKYREVLILKYIEEKNYQEISDIIKKPVGTVGSLINRAKKEFEEKIIDNGKIKI